ncbi:MULTISPECIES: ABC transporter permease [Microbacterium]|uniref:ABC transporter permease n=1 Tax=Microbacterium TaxID=33882 RepID=UPI002787A55A|nr:MULTISPECIES: ABC transporter permease [Microbacterium]MDQ1085366.1 ABC-2 type transport system permease protein [Microbacterium sp. SORGH_AS_0344]MDQ1169329.1 ABC-2 type transport system permease protein [Microbacterium proteolyticum]
MSLAAATRSEYTKQFSTAGWWVLGIVLVAYVAFTAGVLAFVFGGVASGQLSGARGPAPSVDGITGLIYSSATAVGYVFPLLVGTLMVTTEFRHKTLTPTFLATPRRGVVLVGKFVVAIAVGLLYGILGSLAAVGAGAAVLSIFGIDVALTTADTWELVGRMLLAFALWALVGIGVGTVVRNQVAAIVIVLAITLFVEPIVRTAGGLVEGFAGVVKWFPSAASDALVGQTIFGVMGMAGGDTLDWWAGGLVLLGYAVALVVIGLLTTWRRDVD